MQQRLARVGYEVVAHCDSLQAWKQFQAAPGSFDVVITDQTMPHLTGDDLARKIIGLRPETPIIVCSGSSSSLARHQEPCAAIRQCISKPVNFTELSRTIRKALEPPRSSRATSGAAGGRYPSPIVMKHVLVIDDDEQPRALTCQILERAGYQVEEAANGRAGLAAFRAHPADLVLTDLIMPDGEGIETIMQLRRDFPALPVLAVSGGGRNGPKDYLALAQQLGACRTLCKPFSRDELLEAVRGARAI